MCCREVALRVPPERNISSRIKSTQTYAKFLEDREKLSVDRD